MYRANHHINEIKSWYAIFAVQFSISYDGAWYYSKHPSSIKLLTCLREHFRKNRFRPFLRVHKILHAPMRQSGEGYVFHINAPICNISLSATSLQFYTYPSKTIVHIHLKSHKRPLDACKYVANFHPTVSADGRATITARFIPTALSQLAA